MANVVEATLRSNYENGIDRGVDSTMALFQKALSSVRNSSAAMSSGVDAAFESVAGSLEGWRSRISQTADHSSSEFHRISLGAVAMGVAIAEVLIRASKAAADFIFDLVKESGAAFDVRLAFDQLTTTYGLQADVLIKQLKVATEGQVGGMTLMKNANKLLQSEIPLTSDQFVKLTENVFKLSKASGVDAVEAINAMTNGLIRGNARGLQAIGIHLDIKNAVSQMAEAQGEASGKIADASRLQAFYADFLKQSTRAADALGKSHTSLEDILLQTKITWNGFIGSLAIAIQRSEVFQHLLEKASEAMLGFSVAREKQNAVALATNRILLEGLEILTVFIQALAIFSYGWDVATGAIKSMVILILGPAAIGFIVLLSSLNQIVQVLAMIPGAAGAPFRAVAGTVRAMADQAIAGLRSIADIGMHAFDGVGNSAKALFGIADKVKELRAEMQQFAGETVHAEQGLGKVGQAAETAAADQKKLNEQLEIYKQLSLQMINVLADDEGKLAVKYLDIFRQINALSLISQAKRNSLMLEAEKAHSAELAKIVEKRAADERSFLDEQQKMEAKVQMANAKEQIDAYTTLIDSLTGEAARRQQALFDKVIDDANKKREEQLKKEISDAVSAASAIEKALAGVEAGKLSPAIGQQALGNIPVVIDQLKAKLAQLEKQPVFGEEQITQILKMKEAIEKLNKLNMSPFRRTLSDLKDSLKSMAQDSTKAWAQLWSDLVTGQENAGKKFLAALLQMAAQELLVLSVRMAGYALAAAAALDFAGAARYAAAAAGIAALSGILSGIASNLAQSASKSTPAAATAGPGGGSSTGSSNPTVIDVNQVGGSANRGQGNSGGNSQHTVTIKLEKGMIVDAAATDIRQNGKLRTVIQQHT